ncbi:hypothetical protein SCLCIDRAFT_1218548 [Scleroderma citrinum Foug A]|uniref:Uncharacterized protein n=1 Tax=Scleroderma citrinum Foug A TaxID=1036808 RepID=A0A0C3DQW3_9AGAM|nr:hypothetical protein SCLCIDRAFT_1218548 [Scleroderma citrinum Foug A]
MHGVSIDGESVDLVSVDSLFAALWAPSEDGTCAVHSPPGTSAQPSSNPPSQHVCGPLAGKIVDDIRTSCTRLPSPLPGVSLGE